MTCNESNLPWAVLFTSIFGSNGDGTNTLRTMEVEDVGDYFSCDTSNAVTFEQIFRLLIDQNSEGKNVLRVTIAETCPTEDAVDCSNNIPDPMAILKKAIGIGADGAPILRICNTAS